MGSTYAKTHHLCSRNTIMYSPKLQWWKEHTKKNIYEKIPMFYALLEDSLLLERHRG